MNMGRTKNEWFMLVKAGYVDDVMKFLEDPKPSSGRRSIAGKLKTLKSKFDMLIFDVHGFQALHYAAKFGHASLITYLLDCGADVNMLSKFSKETSLQLAILGKYDPAALLLLSRGAEFSLIRGEFDHKVALHFAAENGLHNVVDVLVKKGADINTAMNDGGTALHLAAMAGQATVIECLLKNNADRNIVNNRGKTARSLVEDADEDSKVAFGEERAKRPVSKKYVDFYSMLELDSKAPFKKIKLAYRKKAIKIHPDKNPDDPNAQEKFNYLGKAYKTLSEQDLRDCYDRWKDTSLERAEAEVEMLVQVNLRKGHEFQDQDDINDQFKDLQDSMNFHSESAVSAAVSPAADLDELENQLKNFDNQSSEVNRFEVHDFDVSVEATVSRIITAAGSEWNLSMEELNSCMDDFGNGNTNDAAFSDKKSDSNVAVLLKPVPKSVSPVLLKPVSKSVSPMLVDSVESELCVDDIDSMFADIEM